jgi:hypothetical protein
VGKNREKVKAANPDFKSTEIVQELGSMWRTLPQTEKSVYEMEAAKAKADYVAMYGPTTKVRPAPPRAPSAPPRRARAAPATLSARARGDRRPRLRCRRSLSHRT